ncbi:hypothetical protein SAMN05192566_1807 [Methylophilus rhizosphaerae]|uniref:Uncharacterized protein n=1 Tax=Methylophilus rhizosphaerae TaxID=492660 RepID=A0A1G9D683_9PROT|nr:hypothetical protein SAMN05192566_1807 [Methylophilus rhizosphaerae]
MEIKYHAIATPANIQAIFLLFLCFCSLKILIPAILLPDHQATQLLPERPDTLLFHYRLLGKAVIWRRRRQRPLQAYRTFPDTVSRFLATTYTTDNVVDQQQL